MTIVKLEHVGEQFVRILLSIVAEKEVELSAYSFSSKNSKLHYQKSKISHTTKQIGKFFKSGVLVSPDVSISSSKVSIIGVSFNAMSNVDIGIRTAQGASKRALLPIEVKMGRNPLDNNVSKSDLVGVNSSNVVSGNMLHILDRQVSTDKKKLNGFDANKLESALEKLEGCTTNGHVCFEGIWCLVVRRIGLVVLKGRKDWPFRFCKYVIVLEDLISAIGGTAVANYHLKKMINSEDFVCDWNLDIPK